MARFGPRIELLASAARTASVDTAVFICPDDAEGVEVYIDATAIVTTPSVVFTIQGYDDGADDYFDILVSAAVTAVSFTCLRIGQGITAVTNLTTGIALPRALRVRAVAGDADSITYSVALRTWRRP